LIFGGNVQYKLRLAITYCLVCLCFNSPRALALTVNGCEIEPFSSCPGAVVSFAHLSGENLSFANLTGATVTGTDLVNSTLFGIDLSFTDLVGANLSFSDLSFANLTGADLSFARLPFADLSGADLSFADLDDSDLRNANLSGAKLSNIKLSKTALAGALYDSFTIFPMGFDEAAAGMISLENTAAPAQIADESVKKAEITVNKLLAFAQTMKTSEAPPGKTRKVELISIESVEQAKNPGWSFGWVTAILIVLISLAMPLLHTVSGIFVNHRHLRLPPEQKTQ